MNSEAKQNTLEVGAVVIGRNEGLRLKGCLESLIQDVKAIVYVDSGSVDDSVNCAELLGVTVVHLDLSKPFTAARARNEGFSKLVKLYPSLRYIQFVDGDCEVVPNWISMAHDFIENNPKVAVVCGRRRERYPRHSIYNYQCDIEWNTPLGEAKACGGDFLVRRAVFEVVRGFRDGLIAGEEPELCVRLRQAGWKIWRIDEDMTIHDAAINQFHQWWKRTQRAGYAYAEGVYIHGNPPEKHWVKEARRAWIWAFFLPLLIVLAFMEYPVLAGMLLIIYPLQIIRLSLKLRHLGSFAWVQATLLTLGKFAELTGQIRFLSNFLTNKSAHIIEYH